MHVCTYMYMRTYMLLNYNYYNIQMGYKAGEGLGRGGGVSCLYCYIILYIHPCTVPYNANLL